MTSTPTVPGEFGEEVVRPFTQNVPDTLKRANARLQFPPTYVVVGVYRLFTDKNLYVPAWKKCKHGFVRGLGIGLAWGAVTFRIQRTFVELFLMHSSRVTGLSSETIFGYRVPLDLPTYATLIFLSSQVTAVLTYCLSHNLRIARERAYDQTLASRGKGPDFWQPYVEEWDNPPRVDERSFRWSRLLSGGLARIAIKIALYPINFVPMVGILLSAWLRGLGTARYLHQPYFKAKGMSTKEVSTFIEERKWDYRTFGFVAALLEGPPLVGLVFSISNRVGAAMWAHDLEKRQHYVREIKSGAVTAPPSETKQ